MATVQKQIRQWNAFARFRVIPLSTASKNVESATKAYDAYIARKEVEHANLQASVAHMNIDRLRGYGLRV